jgi:HPt (histidine-containing phosphotransfer) domain-containing protein
MSRQQPIELFMPPNMLKAKAGGGLGGLDLAALKRAEGAMETLKIEFDDMMASDVEKLAGARQRYAKTPDGDSRAALLRAAHDIKGQAPTFNFPLIARVAASLSRLIAELPQSRQVPAALVDAHVGAIQVMHRQGLKDTGDKTAQTLCAELDTRVDEILAGKKSK